MECNIGLEEIIKSSIKHFSEIEGYDPDQVWLSPIDYFKIYLDCIEVHYIDNCKIHYAKWIKERECYIFKDPFYSSTLQSVKF